MLGFIFLRLNNGQSGLHPSKGQQFVLEFGFQLLPQCIHQFYRCVKANRPVCPHSPMVRGLLNHFAGDQTDFRRDGFYLRDTA